jgi:DNA topoisomerase-3
MIVCIAEKPSVARDIARMLGATSQHDGYLEGNGYQVTWTFGHLCELKYPEDYYPQWRQWNLAYLPMLPSPFGIRLKQDEGVQKQFHIIEGLMKKAEYIVNCGDAGQEGELIQRWVMQKVGISCPVKRLWISSLTEESIREGFQHLEPASNRDSLYMAGLCRAIGDWVLGMNATRLYTLKYGRREMKAPPLSVGRVQTPTLALIVKRQREIENFVPEPYWVLVTKYRDTLFTAQKGKYLNEEEAQQALAQITGHPFTVTSVATKRGKEAPPRLYDLTSLQVECNKKFSYSADITLNLIQSLYEKHVTTYPRVDTTFLSDDIYPKCPQILNGISGLYMDLMTPLRGKKLKKSKKVFDSSKVTDHHAIIPTGVAANNLTDAERNVFDLVARRFISVFYDDCVFDTTTVEGEAADVPFKVQGKHIVEEGWRIVYKKDKKTGDDDDDQERADKDEERLLPDFQKGESGPHEPQLTKKMTTPPKPYTEATLLRAMETAGKTVDDEELRDAMKENGIGRPSTRAAIIQTLFRRRYIRLERKSLYATATGCELIDIIHEELLKSAELTGRWEKKLRDIERKTYDAAAFVKEIKEMVSSIVAQVKADASNRRVTVVPEEVKTKKGRKQ